MKFKFILFITVILTPLFSLAQQRIGHYFFNGSAYDSSALANHGVVNGATLTTDRFGNPNSAYLFDGINDYISISPTNLLLQEYTYKVWVNNTSNPSGGDRETAISIGSSGGDQFLNNANNYVGGGGVVYNGWGGGGYNTDGSTCSSSILFPVNLNVWGCLVLTRSQDSVKFYGNGTLVFAIPLNGRIAYYGSGTKTANIGARNNLMLPFSGKLDDIEIYNYAISDIDAQRICDDNALGLTKPKGDPKFMIYPNPLSSGNISLIFNNVGSNDFEVEIMDSFGRTVLKKNRKEFANNFNISLPEVQGVFFCKITYAGKIYTQKLIFE